MTSRVLLNGLTRLPGLIVFDLDYTLWPYWCDTHFSTPLRREHGFVYGSDGSRYVTYPDSDAILRAVHEHPDILLACASRTAAIDIARNMLRLLNWDVLFDYMEIYPGSKVQHFQRFRKLSGVAFESMIFFDDEERNIVEVGRLGVQTHLVPRGIDLSLFQLALKQFDQKDSAR
ncbi:unnamed protein product [Dicrocoelium dendriticum]|nr:unnamed protein product [Dicrocoelium dendriticum]